MQSQEKFKVKGIFLDLDGTIVDSCQAYLHAAKTAFPAVGLKSPGLKGALEIPRRLEQGLPISDLVPKDQETFLNVYLKCYYDNTRIKTKPFANIPKTLRQLTEKARLAVITMRHVPKQVVIEELSYFGIGKYFDDVVTGLDTAKPKPSPESLLNCVNTFDINVGECLIAGDSVNDIRAGRAAGAKTVAVLTGLFQLQELAAENPDLILPDITKLPEFIS